MTLPNYQWLSSSKANAVSHLTAEPMKSVSQMEVLAGPCRRNHFDELATALQRIFFPSPIYYLLEMTT